jgi:hypothetical protein
MALSRNDVLKQMLPGLNKLFGTEYDNYLAVGRLRLSDPMYAIDKKATLYKVLRWDGNEWDAISDYLNKEEAEALIKVSE